MCVYHVFTQRVLKLKYKGANICFFSRWLKMLVRRCINLIWLFFPIFGLPLRKRMSNFAWRNRFRLFRLSLSLSLPPIHPHLIDLKCNAIPRSFLAMSPIFSLSFSRLIHVLLRIILSTPTARSRSIHVKVEQEKQISEGIAAHGISIRFWQEKTVPSLDRSWNLRFFRRGNISCFCKTCEGVPASIELWFPVSAWNLLSSSPHDTIQCQWKTQTDKQILIANHSEVLSFLSLSLPWKRTKDITEFCFSTVDNLRLNLHPWKNPFANEIKSYFRVNIKVRQRLPWGYFKADQRFQFDRIICVWMNEWKEYSYGTNISSLYI